MGFDIFSLDTTDLYTFLKILKNKHIAIYHLEYQEDHTYTFLCTWRARRELLSLEGVKRIGSTGVLFFILSISFSSALNGLYEFGAGFIATKYALCAKLKSFTFLLK